MIGVVMCGGRGTRLKSDTEKPLLHIGGAPLVARVVQAMQESGLFERVCAAVSPHTPATKRFLTKRRVMVLDTPGEGYSSDLSWVLSKLRPARVFVISADMPLVTPELISEIASMQQHEAVLAVVVRKEFVESLGVLPGGVFSESGVDFCYSGINIFDSFVHSRGLLEEQHLVLDRVEVAINVNTKREVGLAEKLLVQRAQNLAENGRLAP